MDNLTPKIYQDMVETIEDYRLYLEAEKRMKNASENVFISSEDVLKSLGLTKEDIDNAEEVDIE